jgi:DNA-binding NarL/FixJ family response regulator
VYPRRDAVESEGAEAPLKVLIADDHPLVLMGIRRTLEASEDIEIVGEAHSGAEVLALVERRRPDVVLLDLRMPGVEGVECISQITGSWPDVKVVVLSVCDDGPSVQSALAAGASAYVVKSVKPIDIASVLRQAGGAGAISTLRWGTRAAGK